MITRSDIDAINHESRATVTKVLSDQARAALRERFKAVLDSKLEDLKAIFAGSEWSMEVVRERQNELVSIIDSLVGDLGRSYSTLFWVLKRDARDLGCHVKKIATEIVNARESESNLRQVVRVVVVEPDGRVWFLANPLFKDSLQVFLPGGGVEPGETLEVAAQREIAEETGFHIQIVGSLGSQSTELEHITYFVARRVGGSPSAADVDGGRVTRLILLDPAKAILSRTDSVLFKEAGSYFADCERNERGWCEPGAGGSGGSGGKVTETKEFKQWFGGSKVVDEQGQPLVVYHGSPKRFTKFDKEYTGATTDAGYLGDGFYFGGRGHAAMYANMPRDRGWDADEDKEWVGEPFIPVGAKGALYPVYLSIRNPLVLNEKSNPGAPHQALDREVHIRQALGLGKSATPKDITAVAKKAGYDGIIFNYAHSNSIKKGQPQYLGNSEYVAFDPNQIKSAIGNRGTFDPKSSDISEASEE